MRGIISCLIVSKYNSLILWLLLGLPISCLLYTSDAADD